MAYKGGAWTVCRFKVGWFGGKGGGVFGRVDTPITLWFVDAYLTFGWNFPLCCLIMVISLVLRFLL